MRGAAAFLLVSRSTASFTASSFVAGTVDMRGAAAFLLVSPALGHDHILVQSRPAQTGIRICVLDPKQIPQKFRVPGVLYCSPSCLLDIADELNCCSFVYSCRGEIDGTD
jgi:hypothetical protein